MEATTEKSSTDEGQSRLTVGLGADFDNSEERYLRETLSMLQESYAKAAKPYIDRLVAIHSMRLPALMMVSLEQTEAMGFKAPNCEVTGSPKASPAE